MKHDLHSITLFQTLLFKIFIASLVFLAILNKLNDCLLQITIGANIRHVPKQENLLVKKDMYLLDFT